VADFAALIAAWEAWDAHPTRHAQANLLEDEVQIVAREILGVEPSFFREEVAILRRAGYSALDAITQVAQRHL
jgi:hypothetical protein